MRLGWSAALLKVKCTYKVDQTLKQKRFHTQVYAYMITIVQYIQQMK